MTGNLNRYTSFGWLQIARLGVVQACLGAVVVLTTSTLNRVMVVELALPALLPGVLVALHYLVQIARPRMGFGSDTGARRTPWIVGGMLVLAAGGVLAARATALMGASPTGGIALAVVAFTLIGLGVSASGTSLLVMLAKRVDENRRAAAATVVWVMMIAGFAITSGVAGQLLDPYSPERLVSVTAGVCLLAVVASLFAVRGLEGRSVQPASAPESSAKPRFTEALRQVWAEPIARRFTIFVFLSMLAYSAQDLILEPFAGSVFGFTPGESTSLSGVQHGGVLLGMISAALAGSLAGRLGLPALGSLRGWTMGGCAASALALGALAWAGLAGPGWPLKATVFALGVANGAFSIGAIGSMMRLASEGRHAREGVRMGLWGAAQAIAFGLGGLVGTGASDLARVLIASPGAAYASVFALEALLFLVSAVLAWRLSTPALPDAARAAPSGNLSAVGDPYLARMENR
jgi:BCD family chlorophyll transporter-like MFS transporter